MSVIAQEFDSAPGDRHQALIEAVRAGGPSALAAVLGDQAFLLRELALRPQSLFTPGDAHADAYTQVVGRIHELRSAMDALDARTVVSLADSLTLEKQAEVRARAAQEAGQAPATKTLLREASREAAREVSMLIGKSPASAAHSLASQRRLVADMPDMLTAMATSQITSTVAHGASRSFAPLSPAQRAEADHLLGQRLPDLDGAGSETWDAATADAIAAADPDGQDRRHQQAKQERHVTVRRAEHGMATVSARISALDGAKVRKRLSLEAEHLRATGDRRGHQAIQADSFVDTLLGQEHGMEPATLDIGIMITDRALIHPGAGDLAQIEGYGTVPAEALRDELHGALRAAATEDEDDTMGPDGPALRAVMRHLYLHPRTGELVAVESRARAFPSALATFLLWRDQICRAPYCNAAIRQNDHIRPHAEGGPTCLDNGQGLCAHCNDKEQQLRSVERIGDPATDGHVVEWTSRAGTRRRTRARALTAPEPPPRDGRPRLLPEPPGETTPSEPPGETTVPEPSDGATVSEPSDGATVSEPSDGATVSEPPGETALPEPRSTQHGPERRRPVPTGAPARAMPRHRTRPSRTLTRASRSVPRRRGARRRRPRPPPDPVPETAA